MCPSANANHVSLAVSNDARGKPDAWKLAADAYVIAFRDLVGRFLHPLEIRGYKIECAFRAEADQTCLNVTVHEHGGDLDETTKVFAAAQSARTCLDIDWIGKPIAAGHVWGDVEVELEFRDCRPAAARRLRLISDRG